MANGSRRRESSGPSPRALRNSWINSALLAAIAFIVVVLSHQFLSAFVSHMFRYKTQVSFSEVVSKPFEYKYWSSARVLILYAMPTVLFLFLAVALASFLLYSSKKVTNWYRFLFWIMVFSVLFISAQLTSSPLGNIIARGAFYKGIAVVAFWWGVKSQTLLIFSLASLALNILFGFLTSRLLIRFTPSYSMVQEQAARRKFILTYFLLPLILIMPLAAFLSYPDGVAFFAVVLMHGLLWLPGFFIRGYQYENVSARGTKISLGYALPTLLLIAVILIRIFL